MIGFGAIRLNGGGGGSGAQVPLFIECTAGENTYAITSGLIVQAAFYNKVIMNPEEYLFTDGSFKILIPDAINITDEDQVILILG